MPDLASILTEHSADLAGLVRTRPMIAAAMAICMLSLTGIPPLWGFVGKLSLFAAALVWGQAVTFDVLAD